ncbi:hypothetical protein Tco_1137007 [Tanacetum coccineum]
MEGIEYMIPNLWSHVVLAYDKDVALGISHWGPQRQQFYRAMINTVEKKAGKVEVGDMNVEAKSSSSSSCGNFIEVVIMLILIGSYYCFMHGYYCSTTVNTARTKLMLLHRS